MDSYYVMIRFSGFAVSGFFVPQAINEEDAIKQIKYQMVEAMAITREKAKKEHGSSHYTEYLNRLKSFYASLKRPWRKTKRDRHDPIVKILKWNKPILTGYWLEEIKSNTNLCNLPDPKWEPRPKTG